MCIRDSSCRTQKFHFRILNPLRFSIRHCPRFWSISNGVMVGTAMNLYNFIMDSYLALCCRARRRVLVSCLNFPFNIFFILIWELSAGIVKFLDMFCNFSIENYFRSNWPCSYKSHTVWLFVRYLCNNIRTNTIKQEKWGRSFNSTLWYLSCLLYTSRCV